MHCLMHELNFKSEKIKIKFRKFKNVIDYTIYWWLNKYINIGWVTIPIQRRKINEQE